MNKPTIAIITLAVAIPLGLGGLYLAWKIADNVAASMAASSWTATPAEVTSAELKELRRANSNTITYQATGAYRYQVNGKSYDSTRLALDIVQGSDNIGAWHKDMTTLLKDAMAAKKPITVWVNPADATQSVADKSVRWGMVLFMVPFALALLGAAYAAIWFGRLAWKIS